jgi:hypothetical protein
MAFSVSCITVDFHDCKKDRAGMLSSMTIIGAPCEMKNVSMGEVVHKVGIGIDKLIMKSEFKNPAEIDQI